MCQRHKYLLQHGVKMNIRFGTKLIAESKSECQSESLFNRVPVSNTKIKVDYCSVPVNLFLQPVSVCLSL